MQLELFEPLSIESANSLLHMLNEGRKKDFFHAHKCTQHKAFLLISAKNSNEIWFNIVDENGKTPEGFSANWRNAEHIKQELNLK